jgi:hypothetical protein
MVGPGHIATLNSTHVCVVHNAAQPSNAPVRFGSHYFVACYRQIQTAMPPDERGIGARRFEPPNSQRVYFDDETPIVGFSGIART